MKNDVKMIAASVLSADFRKLGREIEDAESGGADWIHFDITDGHYTPNLTMGVNTVVAARRSTSLPLDVHLMIENPDTFIPVFAEAGADYLCVHAEAVRHLNRSVRLIQSLGKKVGVALGPAVPLESLTWVLEYVDYVNLLAVNPGFGGQSYIPNIFEKIRTLASMIEKVGKEILIVSDGGIKTDTIGDFSAAGVNVFIVGSAIFNSPDYAAAIGELKANC